MNELGPPPTRTVLRCEALVVPKGRASECEDAHAWNAHRAAVCDGASRAFASGRWATVLAQEFLVTELDLSGGKETRVLDGWLAQIRRRWDEQTASATDVPVYVRDALARGSAATFLGVETHDVSSDLPGATPLLEYRAFAVGDSCLFHLRDGWPVEVFPLDRAEQFDTHPALVPTRAELLGSLERVLRLTSGVCGPDDTLLLATDALAEWALRSAGGCSGVWTFLEGADEAEFDARVRDLREKRMMTADDVSLIRCRAVSTTSAAADAGA
ncbi:hypothetical protein ACQEVG_14260 [Streptomyces sp. CA-135486]|uniref:hypothetical protein n=1 Tax=Streptomyces sp. CA-135486 TaxID=3240049 RepID=UPI003D90EBFA